MSILNAIKEVKRDNNNLQDMALLPQALIMQMAQRGEIQKELVPLIISKKAEMIEAVARQRALMQGGAQQPSVMEQKMMEIAQAENPAPEPQMVPQPMAQMPAQLPEDVGIAQNPTPPMQMAGGGIIAFAPGGDVDEDDDEDESYEDYLDELQRAKIENMILNTYQDTDTDSSGIAYAMPSMPQSAAAGIKAVAKEEKGPDDLVKRLQAQIMAKESGGRRYDKEGNLLTSSKGALGEMQVMPYTSRDPGFGIKPARDNSPDELRRVGDEYAAAMYSRYKDPKLAMIAYNMGPGATDKWLAAGADPSKLPKETQGYIRGVSLAEGGEVKRYQTGGYRPLSAEAANFLQQQKDRATPTKSTQSAAANKLLRPSMIGSDANVYPGMSDLNYYNELAAELEKDPTYEPYKQEMEKLLKRNPTLLTARQPATNIIGPLANVQRKTDNSAAPAVRANVPPPANYVPDEAGSPYINGMPPIVTGTAPAKDAPAETPMSATDKLFAQMQDAYAKREARLEAARKQDPWLAGLAAGLGMMGGTSPYALTNIGQGGAQGVAQYATTQKLRAAEEAGLGSLQNKMYSSAMLGELRRDQMEQAKAGKEAKMSQDLQIAKNAFIEKRLKSLPMDEQMLKNYRLKELDGKLTPQERRRLEFYENERRNIELEANRMYASPGAGMKIVGVRG
jgi:hypothetical protein